MAELGELEARHADFEQRGVRVVAASLDGVDDTKKNQADFPHLTLLSDHERSLANATQVIHPHSAPDGGDSMAPTTILVDGAGTVRWLFRPERVLGRLSPDEVLAAAHQQLPGRP
jgi:peroxiredoxin